MTRKVFQPKDALHGSEPEVTALLDALDLPPSVYRIVIDLKADSIATCFVEMYGSKKAIEVLTTLDKGVLVNVVDRTEPQDDAILGHRVRPSTQAQ